MIKIRFRSLCHTIGSIALTIGMLEKVTDPYRGLQDYTKNTLVHFSVGITIRLLILHSWYLHSKRKMPLIQHFTFYSLHHDVKSQLCYTLVHIYTFFLDFSCLFYMAVTNIYVQLRSLTLPCLIT